MEAQTPARATSPSISCVVPAYNEAQNLAPLLSALTTALKALTPRWEVVLVDDGSTDATPLAVLPWLEAPGVRYLRLSRNFGKEAALTAGIDEARGEVVVLLDADLQHPPEMIGTMLAAWRDGADMVCTARASREDETWRKRLGTRLFYRLVNASLKTPIPEDAGDFRLMDRRVVDALKRLPERNRFMKGLYAWVGFKTVVLPYQPAPRHAGETTFSMKSLSRLAFTGITAFTNAPLRWWSGLGAVVAAAALGFATWIVVADWVVGHEVPGWATLVTGMAFSLGVQLLSIGILGEYIGRIFDEVKQRPVYLIQDALGRGALQDGAPPADPPHG
jgi:glycosyltransferase involved in cell wall biosynthesis